jgi:hypothetical protein
MRTRNKKYAHNDMKKSLNLSIEEDLIQRAKQEAERRGTSVSQMVGTFFATLETGESRSSVPEDYTPSERIRTLRSSTHTPDSSVPEDPSWDEERLVEILQEKHR